MTSDVNAGGPTQEPTPGDSISLSDSEELASSSLSEPLRWLILTYKVPNEPTRLRAALWRRLRLLGAVYLVNGSALLPQTPSHERSLRALRGEIISEMHGSASLFSSEALLGEEEVVSTYNAARDDEYEEIIDRCVGFLAEVEKEVVSRHFTFAELEENEEDLAKLHRWFDKVQTRDVLGAKESTRAREALSRCALVLESYADKVYSSEAT